MRPLHYSQDPGQVFFVKHGGAVGDVVLDPVDRQRYCDWQQEGDWRRLEIDQEPRDFGSLRVQRWGLADLQFTSERA